MLWPLQKRSLAEYTGYFLLLKSNFEKIKLFLIITKISFIMHRSENTRSQKNRGGFAMFVIISSLLCLRWQTLDKRQWQQKKNPHNQCINLEFMHLGIMNEKDIFPLGVFL